MGDICARNPRGSPDTWIEASKEQLSFNDPHPPARNAVEAFSVVDLIIKEEIIKSRHHWNRHEPRMWSRAAHLSDHKLTSFSVDKDLVLVSSAATAYGTIILGKIRIPGINDDQGEGFVHVRFVVYGTYTIGGVGNGDLTSVAPRGLGFMTHQTRYYRFHLLPPIALLTLKPCQGTEDITFHSIFTDEGNRDKDGHPTTWRAIQTADTPLVFFNE